MAETMTLIAGRTSKQGTTLNAGKLKDDYREVTSSGEMNQDDMARLGLKDGDLVRLSTGAGDTVIRCSGRKPEDLPAGLIFLPYGPPSSQLMTGDTALSGMPLSKNIEVQVEPLGAPEAEG
ncbi:MAG: molybdopterin dinucleotide binding domain-containing protein [Pseudomonadota bacterium]